MAVKEILLHQTKDWLTKKYTEEELSINDIAKISQRSFETIRYWLLKLYIPIRSINEAGVIRWKNNKINIPKEDLIDKYINKEKTLRECANDYHCDSGTIVSRLKEYNIPIRGLSEALKGREVWDI